MIYLKVTKRINLKFSSQYKHSGTMCGNGWLDYIATI